MKTAIVRTPMNRDLLDRFYQGKCTPEEVAAVLAWFKKKKPGKRQDQQMLALWQESEQGFSDAAQEQDAQRRWTDLQQLLKNRPETESSEAVVRSLHRPVWKQVLQIAAVFAVLLGAAGVWVYKTSQIAEVTTQLMTAVAKPGMKKTIHLEDGSTIYLNAGSSVTYPVHFAADRRDITLEGEAFFEVAKDKSRPFTVRSGSIATQALGTSFNIHYHPEDATVSVALATGKVRIDQHSINKEAHQLATLTPGQQLVYDHKARKHQIEAFSAREVLGWKDGVLNFKKASLQQVIGKLENWYGVKIEVVPGHQTKMKEWNYTGEYENQSLDEVLEGIGFVKNFSYEEVNGKVRIKFNQS